MKLIMHQHKANDQYTGRLIKSSRSYGLAAALGQHLNSPSTSSTLLDFRDLTRTDISKLTYPLSKKYKINLKAIKLKKMS